MNVEPRLSSVGTRSVTHVLVGLEDRVEGVTVTRFLSFMCWKELVLWQVRCQHPMEERSFKPLVLGFGSSLSRQRVLAQALGSLSPV